MSSVSDSTISNRGHSIAPGVHLETLLPLNDLFKESFYKAKDKHCSVVVRCENLPVIRGNREECMRLFNILTESIFSAPPNGSKRFLYVDCEEDKSLQTPPGEGFQWFRIRFHTNITTGESWMKAHQEALDDCTRILSAHGANFAAHHINHTGCLFSITVAGKSQ